MTSEQKLASLKQRLTDNDVSDELLLDLLEDAKYLILNKMYQVREMPVDIEVPQWYERVQIKIAIELFNKRGAEGEYIHAENGISRTYYSITNVLNEVKPLVGSVVCKH